MLYQHCIILISQMRELRHYFTNEGIPFSGAVNLSVSSDTVRITAIQKTQQPEKLSFLLSFSKEVATVFMLSWTRFYCYLSGTQRWDSAPICQRLPLMVHQRPYKTRLLDLLNWHKGFLQLIQVLCWEQFFPRISTIQWFFSDLHHSQYNSV